MSAVTASATSTALPGSPFPFGATPGEGARTSPWRLGADTVQLCLFDGADG